MNYPTYIPMQQPAMQPMMQRPAMPPQPQLMRPMYGGTPPVIRVNGRPGADAFMLGPNEEVILLDANEDIFYYKATDGGGYPSTRAYRFEPLPESGAAAAVKYATLDDLEALRVELAEMKGVIAGGKQSRKTKTDAED